MKKMLSVFMLLAVVFASACHLPQAGASHDVDFDCLTLGEPVNLLDKEDISITLSSVEKLDTETAEIVLDVENKTENKYSLLIIPIRINNTVLYMGNSKFEILPGKQNNPVQCLIPIDLTVLSDDDSNEFIHTANFVYYISDEKQDKVMYYDLITVSRGELAEGMSVPDKYLIGSDEYFDVYFSGAAQINFVEVTTLLFYNKTDEILYFDLNALAINNISIPTYSHIPVEPKSYYYYFATNPFSICYSELFANNFDNVRTIEVDFRCYINEPSQPLSQINEKLILDNPVKAVKPEGQVIYKKNDIKISVRQSVCHSEDSDIYFINLDWQVKNNSKDLMHLIISNIKISSETAELFQNGYRDTELPFYVLPGTIEGIMPLGCSIVASEQDLMITAELLFYNEQLDEYTSETVEFVLE